jgi:hypothetical protein
MRVIYDETLCCFVTFFVMIPDFIIDKGVRGSSPMIYDETEMFVIKSDFYNGFKFVVKIFIIEVDISSGVGFLSLNV